MPSTLAMIFIAVQVILIGIKVVRRLVPNDVEPASEPLRNVLDLIPPAGILGVYVGLWTGPWIPVAFMGILTVVMAYDIAITNIPPVGDHFDRLYSKISGRIAGEDA